MENGFAGQRCDFVGLGVTTMAEPLSGINFIGPSEHLEQSLIILASTV